MLAGAVAGRAPSLGIASAAINHHTPAPGHHRRHRLDAEGDHRGQVRHVVRPRLLRALEDTSGCRWSPRRSCVTSSGSCASCGPTAYLLDHDGPAGTWPVLHNLHGLDGRGTAARARRGRAEDDGARRRAVRLRRHAHVLQSEQATTQLDRGGTRGARAARGRDPDVDPHLVVPGRRTRRPLRGRSRCRRGVGRLVTYFQAYGDTLVSVERLGPGRLADGSTTSELFIEASGAGGAIDADRLDRDPRSGSARWCPTSGSPPRPTAGPRTPPATIARELGTATSAVAVSAMLQTGTPRPRPPPSTRSSSPADGRRQGSTDRRHGRGG